MKLNFLYVTIFIYEIGMEGIAADKDSAYAHSSLLTAAEFMQMIADMNDGLFRRISTLEAAKGTSK